MACTLLHLPAPTTPEYMMIAAGKLSLEDYLTDLKEVIINVTSDGHTGNGTIHLFVPVGGYKRATSPE